MNNVFYSIVNFIFYKTQQDGKLKDISKEITRDLLNAGFDSDDINQAYYYLGYYLKNQNETENYPGNFEMSMENNMDIIETLNNLVILLRETNMINDQHVKQAYITIRKLKRRKIEPELLYELIDSFFNGLFDEKTVEDILFMTPLALQYRDVI